MNGKELRSIRIALGLTQKQFAERLRISSNSVARMERNEMIVTPPMELLMSYVAREAGVEAIHPHGSRRHSSSKPKKGSGIANSKSESGKRTWKDSIQRRGRSRLPKKSD